MVNEKIRKAIVAYCEERGLEGDDAPLLFDNHAYDDSIVGISDDGRVVYDFNSMVEELMEDEGEWTYEEAVEWIEYNTVRSIPYAGPKAPIVIDIDRDRLFEQYGD